MARQSDLMRESLPQFGGGVMHKYAILAAGILLGSSAAVMSAQSLDDLNIQFHGYATQGFLYTNQNNIFTTSSTNGSPAWSEAVVNLSAQPEPKLRIGVQGRYFLLGNYGNAITLDWAAADYKASDRFGVRFGKVKIPNGLLNETQDIDPSYMWSLLPQSIYPITSRNSSLAEDGGVVYGTLPLGTKFGKLEYRGWGGEEAIGPNDGYWISFKEEGIALTNGLNTVNTGTALHWKAPVSGLMLGASFVRLNKSSSPFTDTYVVPAGPSTGITITTPGAMVLYAIDEPQFFGRYEKNRFMMAGEYERSDGRLLLSGLSPIPSRFDTKPWYAMTSYKVTDKLTAGTYHTEDISHQSTAVGPARYFKDWAISGRYDFNQYLYAKAEQHFIDGTSVGFDAAVNPSGLQPTTKLTVLKMGVSF
jgi:hypothetical protein